MSGSSDLRPLVEAAFSDPDLLQDEAHSKAVLETIDLLDKGELRVAEPNPVDGDGDWLVHGWVRQAILLYFRIAGISEMNAGDLVYYD